MRHNGCKMSLIVILNILFFDPEWLAKASFQKLSNGYYVGELSSDGKRNGTGIYVWNEGDII